MRAILKGSRMKTVGGVYTRVCVQECCGAQVHRRPEVRSNQSSSSITVLETQSHTEAELINWLD